MSVTKQVRESEARARSRAGEVHRPLMTTTGLVGLTAAVFVVLALLLPTAVRRQALALELLPDALSLVYLDLTVARRPDDAQLRFQVAKKALEASRFASARDMLAPLLEPGSALARRAADLKLTAAAIDLRLEIDRRAWAAIDPRDSRARTDALRRVLADVDAIDLAQAPAERVLELAELCTSLAQPARAGALLERLVRRGLPDFAEHVRVAETALLQADQTPRAVELHVFAAEHTEGAVRITHALRALELARGVRNAAELFALAEDLRQRFGPDDLLLTAASLDLAQTSDIKAAFGLAQRLLRARPNDTVLRRRVAQLAEWNGYGLRALDEYVWLLRREGRADDRVRAIELARAHWDLQLLRQLLADSASDSAGLSTDGERVTKRARRAKRSRSARAGRVSTSAATTQVPTRRTAHTCGPRASRRVKAALQPPNPRLESQRRRLRESISLYEALGDPQAALDAIDAALRGPLAADVATWQAKVDMLARAGRTQTAADALTALVEHFPSQARATALANMRLALGQPREALRALTSAPEPYAEAYLRQLFDVAWEVGALDVARHTVERLSRLPGASAWDLARLYQLQRSDADPGVALATALEGWRRFKNAEMLRLVIESTARAKDDARVAGLLQQAESFLGFRTDPGYWQQRITVHQRLAFAAFEQRQFVAAKRELGEAEKALDRAPKLAPASDDLYELLWTSQHAQALAIALEANDTRALAQVFSRYGSALPVRQRVYVLHRLDRHEEASALARLAAADPRVSADDRAALRADAPPTVATAGERPDYVRAGSELFDSEGLRLWTNQAELVLDGRSLGLSANAAISDITAQKVLRALSPRTAREVSAELGGRVFGTELAGGFRVRDGGDLRPFGRFEQAVFGERGNLLSLHAAFNALSFESTQLRLLGASDDAALQSSIPLGSDYYVSARAAASRYVTFEREYLGAGVTLDSSFGRSFALGEFARAALRVTGRYAPRFADSDYALRDAADRWVRWVPSTSEFAGVGASLARGELAVPKLGDPAFRFLLDGSIGVLWPEQKLGWSGQAGLGSALFGADQLSASLHAGNVVGSTAYWTVQAGYAVGL